MAKNPLAVRQAAEKVAAQAGVVGPAVVAAVVRMAVEAAVLVPEEALKAVLHPPPKRQHPAGRLGTGNLLRS